MISIQKKNPLFTDLCFSFPLYLFIACICGPCSPLQESKGSVAVRMALGETQIVQETRQFLLDNSVSLDSFSQVCLMYFSVLLIQMREWKFEWKVHGLRPFVYRRQQQGATQWSWWRTFQLECRRQSLRSSSHLMVLWAVCCCHLQDSLQSLSFWSRLKRNEPSQEWLTVRCVQPFTCI